MVECQRGAEKGKLTKKPLHNPFIINAAFGVLVVHERAVCLAPPSPNMQSYFGIVQEKAVGQSEG